MQSFKQYLIEVEYDRRTTLQPLILRGTSSKRRGRLTHGRFPVIRFYNSHWRNAYHFRLGQKALDIPPEQQKVEEHYWMLVDPQPIIVRPIKETKMGGNKLKRLTEVEFLQGTDQMVSYWTRSPYKRKSRRTGQYREDPNVQPGHVRTLDSVLDERVFVMTKDLR